MLGRPGYPCLRSYVDDLAAIMLLHPARDPLTAQERGSHIDRHHPVPGLHVLQFQRGGEDLAHSGIVDQYVDASELAGGSVDHGVQFAGFRHVRGYGHRLSTHASDSRSRFFSVR